MPKKSSKKSAANTAKCSCDDPYKCACGNRPPRPSKGHKWDPEAQAWGGKGHKQKGASGQTASVSKEATTTNVGKTKIEQWQRMPSRLLEDVCKREGRPRPKFKEVGNYAGRHKFRVIVQDAKAARRGGEHDIILAPAQPSQNLEQAREEAALLALLHLTPSIPHERKLPEPYKTTWLNALEAAKKTKSSKKATKESVSASSKQAGGSSAASSSNLTTSTSFVSVAEKKRQQQEKQKARKDRIRKHEAVRMANRDHQVFLSASCRKRVETLLRGGGNLRELLAEAAEEQDNENRDDAEQDGADSDLKAYVAERLHNEGFTRTQARAAYKEFQSKAEKVHSEDQWDLVYDECLQWLCIHLDEDQLPEGFDPRGRTLDVVVAHRKTNNGDTLQSIGGQKEHANALVAEFGIGPEEADSIRSQLKSDDPTEMWAVFCKARNVSFPVPSTSDTETHQNREMSQEEIETLQAIFMEDELSINRREGDLVVVRIRMPNEAADPSPMEIEIVFQEGLYPSVLPKSVLMRNGWIGKLREMGTAVHLEIIKFVASLETGSPMIYEIFGQAQSLLQQVFAGELHHAPLTEKAEKRDAQDTDAKPNKHIMSKGKTKKIVAARRPRERSFFWTKKPQNTPPATSFPKLSVTIDKQRKSLPAAKAREEFLSIMKKADNAGRVVLVTGETGCGKTTQIPQYILEESPIGAKIVVTQPRRLAATGVATRVANERGEKKPGLASIGYVVRGDTAMCNATRLMFCTTGVLLRQLQSEGALDCVSHIIVDEVHERQLDTDVLLGVLKDCLKSTPNLRVVLMSATLDADRFAAYWGDDTPRMHIPGRTFPVHDYVLEDVLSLTGYIPPKKAKRKKGGFNGNYKRRASPWDDSEKSDTEDIEEADTMELKEQGPSRSGSGAGNIPPVEELVKRVDQTSIDYDLLGQLVKYLVQTKKSDDDGSILVFLPGAPEINNASNTIRKIVRGMSIRLLPLHGGLQPKDQNLVFQKADRGTTKVILSTNVAETSITIPDCTIVIDSCREKQSSYDPVNRMPMLVERFASKDSLKQRRGRAGRVRSGTCYKLISHATLAALPEHGEPEIRRCALDQTLLSLLFLGVENGTGNFLRRLLDPPSSKSIDAAITSLARLGAVEAFGDESILTPLGMHLAGIPAPPAVGKMLVMGCILGCRSAAVAMAAGMSVGRSPFLRINTFKKHGHGDVQGESMEEFRQQNILKTREELFSTVGNSDHAFLAAVYTRWDSLESGGGSRKRFCESLGLSFNGMRDIKQLVRQLNSSLDKMGFGHADNNSTSWRIIRACAVSALAPSNLVRVQRPSTKYTETVEGAVEKDGEAREIKFFIRGEEKPDQDDTEVRGSQYRGYHGIPEERVFMHPSSANFKIGSYNCPWLVYFSLVRTSKPFLRDATESSAYALLLFGGSLTVQAANELILIDNWARLSANARIGALIGGLRRKVDELLEKKVKDPSFDIAETPEMQIIVSLLVTDGLGQ